MKRLSTALILTAIWGFAQSADSPYPSVPDGEVAGHGYVDLGLPSETLWAACNIGADSPYNEGEHFAWGETEPRDVFNCSDYRFFEEEYKDDQGNLNYYATEIGEQISGTEYDAARTRWGDAWRMPTKEDFEELMECCRIEYKEYSLIPPKKGLLISGSNGKSILIPPVPGLNGGIDLCIERGGEYWTATVNESTEHQPYPAATMMGFSKGSSTMAFISESRHYGLSIRPVIRRKEISSSVGTLTETSTYMKYDNGIITIKGNASGFQLTVSDISGRNICRYTIDDNTCRLPSLSKGVYIITLHKDGKTAGTLKITVK